MPWDRKCLVIVERWWSMLKKIIQFVFDWLFYLKWVYLAWHTSQMNDLTLLSTMFARFLRFLTESSWKALACFSKSVSSYRIWLHSPKRHLYSQPTNQNFVGLAPSFVIDNDKLFTFEIWNVGFDLTGVMWTEGGALDCGVLVTEKSTLKFKSSNKTRDIIKIYLSSWRVLSLFWAFLLTLLIGRLDSHSLDA